jgi:hypothetical protein
MPLSRRSCGVVKRDAGASVVMSNNRQVCFGCRRDAQVQETNVLCTQSGHARLPALLLQ